MDGLDVEQSPEVSNGGLVEGESGATSTEMEEPAEAPESEEPSSGSGELTEEPEVPPTSETLILEPELEMPEPGVLAPGVENGISGETVQDLIGAIDNLNETIVGAMPEEGTEDQSVEEGADADPGAESPAETASVEADPAADPVVQLLERSAGLLEQTTTLLEAQNDALLTQHNDLLQIQANLDMVFLGLCLLVGVVLGCFVGRVFHDLWRSA